jgi:hypothetical protein
LPCLLTGPESSDAPTWRSALTTSSGFLNAILQYKKSELLGQMAEDTVGKEEVQFKLELLFLSRHFSRTRPRSAQAPRSWTPMARTQMSWSQAATRAGDELGPHGAAAGNSTSQRPRKLKLVVVAKLS